MPRCRRRRLRPGRLLAPSLLSVDSLFLVVGCQADRPSVPPFAGHSKIRLYFEHVKVMTSISFSKSCDGTFPSVASMDELEG